MDRLKKLYRYRFDLDRNERSLDILDVVVTKTSTSAKYRYHVEITDKGRTKRTEYFDPETLIGSVRPFGSLRYVYLDEEDDTRAIAVLLGYEKGQRERLKGEMQEVKRRILSLENLAHTSRKDLE